MNYSDRLCTLLEHHGVRHIFAFPGAPSADFFDALGRSTIETVVATSESSAAFAALGYGATNKRPGILCVIGGPGLSLASTALLEARCDSIPVVCLAFVRHAVEGKSFQTQHMDYQSLGTAVCKQVFDTRHGKDLGDAVSAAMQSAVSGEPGPVIVLVHADFVINGPGDAAATDHPMSKAGISTLAKSVQKMLAGPGKKLIFAGRGASNAAPALVSVAERYAVPVISTTSARGVIPEDHALCLRTDLVSAKVVNEFIDGFDHILALGVKFSQNSLAGYQLQFPPEKLVHIDANAAVLGKNVRASRSEVADVPLLLTELAQLANDDPSGNRAPPMDLDAWRKRFSQAGASDIEPSFDGVTPPNAASFFGELQRLLARNTILVTDSGLHQMLARRHYVSRSVNGLLVPTNFQSMGFGIAAAIGAKIAAPERPVVAVVGDGGLCMSGLELLTAVRQGLPITIIVFEDRHYSEVRNKQLAKFGDSFGMGVPAVRYGEFAESIGVGYVDGASDPIEAIGDSLNSGGVRMVRVCLHDSPQVKGLKRRNRIKSVGKRLIGKIMSAS